MENSTETKNQNSGIGVVRDITKVIADGYLELKDKEIKEREEVLRREREHRKEEREEREMARRRDHDLSLKQIELEKEKLLLQRPVEIQLAELQQKHKKELKTMIHRHEKQLEEIKAEANKPESVRLAEIEVEEQFKEFIRKTEIDAEIAKFKLVVGGICISIVGIGILAYKFFKR